MATAVLSRALRGGDGAGVGAGLATRDLLSASISKAPRRAPSLPAMVPSRGFCSNGGGKCDKMADLVEMNGRIDRVENELKYEVQLMKFEVEKQRAWARAEMMEAEANRMEFRLKLMCIVLWGGSVGYLTSHL